MGLILLVAAFMVPALSTGSGRQLDGASHQLASDLENARLIAIAERTRTRVLLPASSNNFSNPTAANTPWPADIAARGYVITSQKRTETTWTQRGRWTRLPDGVAFASFSPTPAPTPLPIASNNSGTRSYDYTGPYIEFLANGSCSLDPTATPPEVIVADGFVDNTGAFKPKNRGLRVTLATDPLTGAVTVK